MIFFVFNRVRASNPQRLTFSQILVERKRYKVDPKITIKMKKEKVTTAVSFLELYMPIAFESGGRKVFDL